MTNSLPTASQSLTPSAKVTLYRFDATSVGASIYFFTPTVAAGGQNLTYANQVYTPVDIYVDGFEVNAGGSLPMPKMQIANSDLFIQSLVNQYGDLAGCEIRRIRTFAQFLDGQPDADPTAYVGPDVFRVERKSDENPVYIEWELSAAIDQEGKQLPGRQFIRDVCMRRYREYGPTLSGASNDGFLYPSIFPCPYTGANYFDEQGNATTGPNDSCGRRVSDCKLRFGANAGLPGSFFPGIGRAQT